MSIELTVLAWGCVLGVAQIFVAAKMATRQYGAEWGLSSREKENAAAGAVRGSIEVCTGQFSGNVPNSGGRNFDHSGRWSEQPDDSDGCYPLACGPPRVLAGICNRHSCFADGSVCSEHSRHWLYALAGIDLMPRSCPPRGL